jgi:two-component system NtrC family response regulator
MRMVILLGNILVIDDEEYMGWVIKKSFEATSYKVDLCLEGKSGIMQVEKNNYDLVFLDLRLPDMDGMEVLQRLKKMQQDIMVVIITAHGSIDTAIESMKMGAFDYITKPFDIDEILLLADKAMDLLRLKREVNYLRGERAKEINEIAPVSSNPELNTVFNSLHKIAASNASILITGESGTGKKSLARRIHQLSGREDYPFIEIDCSTITELGNMELAHKGTVYLHGVDSMNLNLQCNLLNFILDKDDKNIPDNQAAAADIRIIASSKTNLKQHIENGSFREDLYYKLSVIPIFIPPLRERKQDIKDLVDSFIRKYDSSGEINQITPEAMKLLKNYTWPGNIRELENVIERITILNQQSTVKADALPVEILNQFENTKDPIIYFPEEGINLEKVERDLIIKALKISGQNQSRAAQLLGITRSALIYRMQKHGIN